MRTRTTSGPNIRGVLKRVQQLERKVQRLEKLVTARGGSPAISPTLRDEFAAWDAASDEALAKTDTRSE